MTSLSYADRLGNPRMIIAGEFWNGATARSFAHGFRSHGFDVDEFDVFSHVVKSDATIFKLFNRINAKRAMRLANQTLIARARQIRPRLFMAIKGSFLTPETVEELRSLGVYTINFYPDLHFSHTGLSFETLLAFDLIATAKSFHPAYLKQNGAKDVIHVHHGFSPLTHRPVYGSDGPADADYAWDVSYVGTAGVYKRDWLIKVAQSIGDRRFAIVGSGWSKLARGTPIERFVLGHAIAGDGFARTVETSRINLAFHFGPLGEMGWQDWVSSRTFHIPASGGFMLHIDNPEVRSLFEVPGEIDTFASPDELCAKIEYYLTHDAERRAMIKHARARCNPDYSLPARAGEILAHLLDKAA